jgi:osmoprotectant transport system permease protein
MEYLLERPDIVLDAAIQHIYITALTVLIATVIGVVFGVLITRIRGLYEPVLTMAGVIYTVPSLAMFVLMIPLLGIGEKSAIAALVLYSLLIIIRNTAVGIDSVDPNVIEAARGMGMTTLGILFRIELPLALPIIFAGIRIAAVSAISLATIAAFIGAGGIGELIFGNLNPGGYEEITTAALVASVMALGAEVLFRQMQKGASPGVTGEFKTIGEYIADFWHHLCEYPDTIIMLGSILLLVGFFFMPWVQPYSYSDVLEDEANRDAMDEAGYLEMTGYDLADLNVELPLKKSMQILPWLVIIPAVIAIVNTLRRPGNRATAEVLLVCGVLAFVPLLHFYFETRSAVGDLGSYSDYFRAVQRQINADTGLGFSLRPLEQLGTEDGFTVSVIGAGLILVGSYMKSLWFRRRRAHLHEMEEQANASQTA